MKGKFVDVDTVENAAFTGKSGTQKNEDERGYGLYQSTTHSLLPDNL